MLLPPQNKRNRTVRQPLVVVRRGPGNGNQRDTRSSEEVSLTGEVALDRLPGDVEGSGPSGRAVWRYGGSV